MMAVNLERWSLKEIFGTGLPVYMLGAASKVGKDLLQMTYKDGYRFTAIWDEKWLQIRESEQFADLRQQYLSKSYEISPVPADLNALSEAVVIVTQEECYQRKWLSYCEKSHHHIYDGHDIRYYMAYRNCMAENRVEDHFLENCRNCNASLRSCPIRREYYKKHENRARNKVMRHLAMKVGYICNLNCQYCCEHLPRFTSAQKKPFDLEGCLSDLDKLCDSMEYIGTLSFSGGDAMLNRELPALIDRTAQKANVRDIYILTNGTYLPHADILDALERNKNKARIVINNYSINHEAEKIVPELKKRGISYHLRDNAGWYDLSNTSFRNRNVYQLKDLYENCSFDQGRRFYHVMFEGKISMRCGSANALLYYLDKFDVCTEDFIDIRKLSSEGIPDALTCLENRDYLDICNYCAGCTADNRVIEAAADQLRP